MDWILEHWLSPSLSCPINPRLHRVKEVIWVTYWISLGRACCLCSSSHHKMTRDSPATVPAESRAPPATSNSSHSQRETAAASLFPFINQFKVASWSLFSLDWLSKLAATGATACSACTLFPSVNLATFSSLLDAELSCSEGTDWKVQLY